MFVEQPLALLGSANNCEDSTPIGSTFFICEMILRFSLKALLEIARGIRTEMFLKLLK